MLRHDDSVRLRHMLDHAHEAVEMSPGRQRSDLETDRMLELSLVRLLEVLGEAANRVSRQTQEHFDILPWHDIIGLRNRLIHGYNQVDHDILWDIVRGDLPRLIEKLEGVVQQLDSEGRS